MNAESILGVVVQYGLPTVLLFAMAWYHVREQKKWDDRQTEWNTERRELNADVREAESGRADDAKEAAVTISRTQEVNARLTDATNRLVSDFQKWRDEDRSRELRDIERERDRMRDTGSHRIPPIDEHDPKRLR